MLLLWIGSLRSTRHHHLPRLPRQYVQNNSCHFEHSNCLADPVSDAGQEQRLILSAGCAFVMDQKIEYAQQRRVPLMRFHVCFSCGTRTRKQSADLERPVRANHSLAYGFKFDRLLSSIHPQSTPVESNSDYDEGDGEDDNEENEVCTCE